MNFAMQLQSPKNYSSWKKIFQPQKNEIKVRSFFDGTMFETSGEEIDFVATHEVEHPNTVWTLVDNFGSTYIEPGFHIANRLGYFICAMPYRSGSDLFEIPM